ncbi:hypothetical protein [Streptomyces sp. NPDC047981]|uniref:hypothetical protein n=1 Tax=Streptomyces sp. NPDC047981 TaxID=3154610 RepID=UPI003435DBCB
MATTMTPLQPGTEAAAQAAAFAIFGSDIPPIDPEDFSGSWHTTLHVIAEERVGEGCFERHAARTATALNDLFAAQQRYGVGSPQALADGSRLQSLIDRCRHFGIATADLERHGAQFPGS